MTKEEHCLGTLSLAEVRKEERWNHFVFILLVLGALLMMPLMYGLDPLHGLRHKRLYPIRRRTQRSDQPGLQESPADEDFVVEG